MSDYLDIHALADGELSGDDLTRAQARVNSDPQAKAEFEAINHLKSTVRTRATSPEVSLAWKASVARLDELDKRKKVEGFVGKYAWGMCASVFFFILAMGVYNRQFGGAQVSTPEVAKITSNLIPLARPTDQSVSMQDWIQEIPDVNNQTIQVRNVAEGRDDMGRPVVALGIADRHGPMSLVVVRGVDRVAGVEPMLKDASMFAGRVGDANCLMWTANGSGFTLIGQRSHEDLLKVAEGLRGR